MNPDWDRADRAVATDRLVRSGLAAVIDERASRTATTVDRDRIVDAVSYAMARSRTANDFGDQFVAARLAVAKTCAAVLLDAPLICAALLFEADTGPIASCQEIAAALGSEIAGLVYDVCNSRRLHAGDEDHAFSHRKLLHSTSDMRVLVLGLADQLHAMRTISAMPRQKQIENARETLDIYAPIARRLGIHAIKWELEDLAFQTLHPRKYNEIKGLVGEQRAERERYVTEAGAYLAKELDELGVEAEISGRAKHFYSIYSKMTKKGREFNEIYDLTTMRVIVGSVKDCYGAVGVIHSLWKPLPGRFKDFIAMPKFNMYQSLHTTVIGPEGRPLEIQIRTREMHDRAEYGLAARNH